MGGGGSSSKRKSSKRKRDKKKKVQRKETKRHRREYDAASSHSDDESLYSERTSSFTAKSDRGRRKTKHKKHRREPSLSSSFDDKSVSSDSISSSSTHDHKRRHRKGRRSQSTLRSTKKRDRKKLASKSSDSDVGNGRKRKSEGRDVKSRKKPSKKRSRRYSSSDSESCPTCHSGSDSGSDNEHCPRSKLIIDGEKERVRGRESVKTRNKQRVRSPYTSYDEGYNHSVGANDVDGAVTHVDNPRRLKSVIAVVNQSSGKGEDRWEVDPHKEEIVYDGEDYPSPRSLDSYEGATKMESDNSSQGASMKRVRIENAVDEEAMAPGKHKISDCDKNHAGTPQSAGGIEASEPAIASGGDDLESILRQKALENLRKFRGKPPIGPKGTNVKTSNERDVNEASAERADSVQNKPAKPNSSSVRETNSTSVPSLKRNFSQLREAKESLNGKDIEKKAGEAAQSAAVECPKEVKVASSRAALSNHDSREDASQCSGAANDGNSSMEKPTTSAGPQTGDNSSGQQKEEKDGSQFEQRTMMVMRGGEMVQVSYKVYIPKKAPALARRQFRQ